MRLKKVLSLVLALALVLSFAPVSAVKAASVNINDETAVEEFIGTPATIVSDTNPVSLEGTISDGIVAGRKAVLKHDLYDFVIELKSVTDKEIVVAYDYTVNESAAKSMGFGRAWTYGVNDVKYFKNHADSVSEPGTAYDSKHQVGTATIERKDLNVGLNSIYFTPSLQVDDAKWGRNIGNPYIHAGIDIIVAPKATVHKVSDSDFSIYKNSLSIGKAYTTTDETVEVGTVVAYRKAGASDWKEASFTSGKSLNITGLSPNTKYEYKTKNYIKVTYDSKDYELATNYSAVNSVNTAGVAPKVKSIKKTKVKQYKVNVPGQWKDSKWYPAHKEWRTSYTVKVTLSSVPKNVYKIVIDNLGDNSAPTYVKTAKTFKATFVEKGKTKGKKSKLYVYTVASSEKFVGASDNKGKSDVTTKTVKH